jgi:UDPglucose--hexose-1-phosphate uridylyltransferase
MARYIPDVKTRRWVVIAPRRAHRPDEHIGQETDASQEVLGQRNGFAYLPSCPFCFGNEDQTPPEIYRWGRSYPTDTDWIVRVVPNKFPITDIHEVIVHSPDHVKDIVELPDDHVEIILKVYRERFKTLSAFGNVLIFNNKGELAGESLTHPHSQVVVIPQQVHLDVLAIEPINNVIEDNDHFVVYCPDFSQWPYEVWIVPKAFVHHRHVDDNHFSTISDEEVVALVKTLKRSLGRLYTLIPNLAYNYYIYPYSCWYLRIIPRNILVRAGFEHGTGIHVNTIDPGEAAKELRDVGEPKPREMIIE